MNAKQRKVLEMLKQEGGSAKHYFLVQMCDLYFDTDTMWQLKENGFVTAVTTRRETTYTITTLGEMAITPAWPLSDTQMRVYHVALTDIEVTRKFDEGCALRALLIDAYGLDGLKAIEQYSQPVVDAPSPDAWVTARDPWATAREYVRRHRELKAIDRGEYIPPWHNY